MLKTFTGYKGSMAAAQIGDVQFVILAKTPRQLHTLWASIMANAGPLNPAGIKHAILIEASTLPSEPQPGVGMSRPQVHDPAPEFPRNPLTLDI